MKYYPFQSPQTRLDNRTIALWTDLQILGSVLVTHSDVAGFSRNPVMALNIGIMAIVSILGLRMIRKLALVPARRPMVAYMNASKPTLHTDRNGKSHIDVSEAMYRDLLKIERRCNRRAAVIMPLVIFTTAAVFNPEPLPQRPNEGGIVPSSPVASPR